jgi:type IV pilus assembly protein PilW
MRNQWIFKQKGITLIELLVALAIFGIVLGAIYRLFTAQTRAYTIQDEAVEVQQTVRGAMEILLRDLRMTGYDDDNSASTVTITTPIVTPVQSSDITVSYEYQNQKYAVRYWRNGAMSTLDRQVTINDVAGTPEHILENVNALAFTYGVDTNEDGNVDSWQKAEDVGTWKVIAALVTLTASSTTNNPDVQKVISPRTLTSAITFRNLAMK